MPVEMAFSITSKIFSLHSFFEGDGQHVDLPHLSLAFTVEGFAVRVWLQKICSISSTIALLLWRSQRGIGLKNSL